VCIAGIYPDSQAYSTSKFATIQQISVKPEYRRKGIAKAMMLRSINDASNISPAMTLGVLKNNPAEKLYNEVGFRTGDSYSELHYRAL
jgi:ribosomal protein S18 acetylase RimI-like enzyme